MCVPQATHGSNLFYVETLKIKHTEYLADTSHSAGLQCTHHTTTDWNSRTALRYKPTDAHTMINAQQA